LLDSHRPTNFILYDYRLLSYELLNLITFPLSGTFTAHAPCHVTYHRGQQWCTLLKSLVPLYLFTWSLSRRFAED